MKPARSENNGFRIVRPAENLLEEFLEFCRETWGKVHDSYILKDPEQYEQWRPTLLREYREAEQGIHLPPGFTRSVTFWILKGNRMIAIANLRPELTEQLRNYGGHLGLAIRPSERRKGYGKTITLLLAEKAKALGIRELLLTCEAANTASVRLSKSLPGTRNEYDEAMVNGKQCKILRTWLKLIAESE